MRWLALLCVLVPCLAADLPHRIDLLMEANASGRLGSVGIQVVNMATGQTAYHRGEDRLFLPASNMKLLTAALALERLKPGYRFTTRVLLEASGDLALIGAGDPSFSSRTYPYAKAEQFAGSLGAIENLADRVVARGIRKIDGDILGDDRLYPWEPSPPGWTADDRANGYGASVSALTFNDNVVVVNVTAGKRLGDPASLKAAFEYLTLENDLVTGPEGSETNIQARPVPNSNQWILTGSVPLGSAATPVQLPVADPAAYAAAALYDALTRRGVAMHGRPVARHRPPGSPYTAPLGREVASRVSPPLNQLLETMLKISQNLHAELLLREVGRVTHGDGTNDAGVAALEAFLKERGALPADWRIEDGSGLSRNDLLTPGLIVRILERQFREYGAAWTSLLPAGGEDGTLEHRLCCVSQGRGIRAKTGTLNRAVALSGYAETEADGRLAFSILVNDFPAPASEVQQWVDKIATELLE